MRSLFLIVLASLALAQHDHGGKGGGKDMGKGMPPGGKGGMPPGGKGAGKGPGPDPVRRHEPKSAVVLDRRHTPAAAPSFVRRIVDAAPTAEPAMKRRAAHEPHGNREDVPSNVQSAQSPEKRQVPQGASKPSVIQVADLPKAPSAGAEFSWADAIKGTLGLGKGQ